MRQLALAALLVVAAGTARADGSPVIPAGPEARWGFIQFGIAPYSPNIDSGTFTSGGLTTTPYATVFGTSRPLLFQLFFSRSLWLSEVGTLDAGVGAGYWQVSGQGIYQYPNGTTVTGSTTSLLIVPLTLDVQYRFDIFYDEWRVPLEPYARLSFVDKLWWAKGQNGTSTYTSPSGQIFTGQGATYGWSGTLGLALVLDAFDPALARQMTYDTGIVHTMLTFDFTKESVNDFGSRTSWQLAPSSWMWSAGLVFLF